jgi:hypothetical protein
MVFATSGMSRSEEASVGGMVSSISVPAEDMTHTYVEGCMSGGSPWYVPSKDGALKILGSISMIGYALGLVLTRGRMLSMLEKGLVL